MSLKSEFRKQMKEVQSITIDGVNLLLMQKYVIWRMITDNFFFNTSGTGTGKTIAALALAKFLNLKVLVITNNSGVDSYKKDNNKVKLDESMIHIVNYDKFSIDFSKFNESIYIKTIIDFNPELIVLDEVHYVKTNEMSISGDTSMRSKIITKILSVVDYKKLLIQTATPVINNVSETESLIKIGIPDYETKSLDKISRQVKAYTTLVDCSISFPKIMMEGGDTFIPIKYSKKTYKKFISKKDYDEYNFDNKFDAMSSEIKKGVIIYTKYSNSMVDRLVNKVESTKNLKCGRYTGDEKDKDFSKYDVMIITSAGSTGTDGLQKYFDTMIFFSLPDTWGSFIQAIGRIDRINGSKFESVNIMYLQDEGDIYPSTDQHSWNRILGKKIICDLVKDGVVSKSKENKKRLKCEIVS